MKLLRLEFFKCRRRKIALVCAAVLAAELLWFGAYLARQDAGDLACNRIDQHHGRQFPAREHIIPDADFLIDQRINRTLVDALIMPA